MFDPSRPLRFGHDLITPYTVGRLVLAGEGSRLYDPDTLEVAGRRLMTEANLFGDPRQVRWLNPGWFAAPFVPLALLPYRWALVAWTAANAALFTGAMAALLRAFPPARRRSRLVFGSGVVASCPFLLAFGHQQNTFLSLALVVAIIPALRPAASHSSGRIAGRDQRAGRGRLFRAGLLIGLLAYKPQLAAGLGVVVAIVGGRRAVAGMVLSGLAMLVLGEMVAPGSTVAFAREVPKAVSAFQADAEYNWGRQVTPTAFWRTLGGPAAGRAGSLGMATGIVVLITLAATAWRARRRQVCTFGGADGGRAKDLLPLAVLALPLAAPYLMDYDLLLLAVPAAAQLGHGRRRPATVVGWAGLWVAAFVNVDAAAAVGVNLVPCLVAVLFAASARRAWMSGRHTGLAVPVATPSVDGGMERSLAA